MGALLMMRTLATVALAIAVLAAVGEASPEYELAGPTDEPDDLPPYLQDMQDSMYESEDQLSEARDTFNKAKADEAKKTHKKVVHKKVHKKVHKSHKKVEHKVHKKEHKDSVSSALDAVAKEPVRASDKPEDMMEQSSEMQAQVSAAAKAEYEQSMAHMKKLSEEFGRKAKEYEARSKKAGVEEEKAARREHKQVVTAVASFPWLGLSASKEDITKNASPPAANKKSPEVVSLTAPLEHKEIDRLVATETKKRAQQKGPMGSLKIMQDEMAREGDRNAQSIMKWTALRDGWRGKYDAPDEGDVRTVAMALEVNAEKTSGHKLSKGQKDAILDATRQHEMAMARIKRTQARINAMNKLVKEDDREAKKSLAREQAEGLLDENDAMKSRVNAAKSEANLALQAQKLGVPRQAEASLMKSFAQIQKKAQAYEEAEAAVEALKEI